MSPIDKSEISGRAALREHNRVHNVVDNREYGENYFKRKAKERRDAINGVRPSDKKARINAIIKACEKHGI